MNEEGIITVGNRVSKWMETNWNRNEYILLPPKHPFTKLLILHFHNHDHSGVESTLVKLQGKFWVPGVRRLIKNVKSRCVMCRKIEKVCETHCMSEFHHLHPFIRHPWIYLYHFKLLILSRREPGRRSLVSFSHVCGAEQFILILLKIMTLVAF